MRSIYLDNSATTMLDPEVAEVLAECLRTPVANPASQHGPGRRARRLIEDAREAIVEMLGGNSSGMGSDRLIFTSGGTESNNLALQGLAGEAGSLIAISAIEHPSVQGPADRLAGRGHRLIRIPVDRQGVLKLDGLMECLDDLRLVSVMMGNHETGALQPVAEVAHACRKRGVLIHTDAVQAVGKVAVNFRHLAVDALSFTAHKFHGPVGIGGLMLRSGVAPVPLFAGGFQQAAIRPGTEPVALVCGMQRALQIALRNLSQQAAEVARLRDRLADQLRARWPQLLIAAESVPRLPHIVNISFPGVDRQALVMALDLAGVACSTGSACASGSSELSPVLVAMGLPEDQVQGAIRLSVSRCTTETEVDEAVERISNVVNNLQRGNPAAAAGLPPRVPAFRSI